MAAICKQVFSAQTIKVLEELKLDTVFDKEITNIINQIRNDDPTGFGATFDNNPEQAFKKSAKIVLEELKTRKANEFASLRPRLEEEFTITVSNTDISTKIYDDNVNAYVFILNEALRKINNVANVEVSNKLPSIIKAIETNEKIVSTVEFFMSEDFAITQSRNKQWQERNNGSFGPFKNAIKEAKLYQDSGGTKGTMDNLMYQVFMGLIANNNFQKGVGLEDLRSSNLAKYWFSNINKTLTDELGTNWHKQFAGKELLSKFYDLRQKIARGDTETLSENNVKVTDGVETKILNKMYDVYKRVLVDNNLAGGKLTQLHFADRVQFNSSLFKTGSGKTKIEYEAFRKDIVPALDDLNIMQLRRVTDGNQSFYTKEDIMSMSEAEKLTLKNRIAEKIYQKTTDYRAIDFSEDGNISSYLLFKNGADEYKIRSKYTTEEPAESLFGQFRRLSDENAITKLYGKNVEAFLKELRGQLQANSELKKYVDSDGFKVFQSHLRAAVEPSMLNKTKLGQFFSGMRNINVGHLGWIILDQLMVEPFYAYSRLVANRKKTTDKFNMMTGFHPLMASKQQRQIAKQWGIAIESYIGATKMRFYNTFGNSLNEGKILGMTERFANGFMRFTASSYMSDGQAAIGLAVLRNNVSEMLNANKSWAQLPQAYKRELTRHGLTRQDYDQTLQMWRKGLLHENSTGEKLFDIFLIPDELDKRTLRLTGLRDKWHKYFSSNVDGLARIRAGDMERMRLNLYATDDQARGVIGALLKTITQFKSFSFAVGRRFHGKELQDSGMYGVALGMAPIVVTTMIGAIGYVQTKEMLNGRNPYRFDDAELYKMAITRTPFLGVLAVVPFTEMFVQNAISLGFDDEMFTAKNFRDDAFRNILGPVFDQYTDLVADTLGVPRTLQTYGLVEGAKKAGVKITKDLSAIFSPLVGLTHPLLSGFRYYLLDVVEEALDPEGFYRKVKKREKYAREERYNKRFEQNWVRDLPGGR